MASIAFACGGIIMHSAKFALGRTISRQWIAITCRGGRSPVMAAYLVDLLLITRCIGGASH